MSSSTWQNLSTNERVFAPNGISEEMEVKISNVVADVLRQSPLKEVTPSLIREKVEKKLKISLKAHKTLMKRIIHAQIQIAAKDNSKKTKKDSEKKEVMKSDTVETRANKNLSWQVAKRSKAIEKGLEYVYTIVKTSPAHFNALSVDVIQSLSDFSSISFNQILQNRAMVFAQELGANWFDASHQYADWKMYTIPTPKQVVDVVKAMHCMQQLQVGHPRESELRFCLQEKSNYTPANYFGWDPSVGPPPSDGALSPFKLMSNALCSCYYGSEVNVSFGCTYDKVFKWMPVFYPYKGPNELDLLMYRDQCSLAVCVIMTLSNWGKLQCEPEVFPNEFNFLYEHIGFHISRGDIFMVGETLQALRRFGLPDHDPVIRRGSAFILFSQSADGSWYTKQSTQKQIKNTMNDVVDPATDDDSSDVAYSLCHGTLACLCALVDRPTLINFAPYITEVIPVLKENLNLEANRPIYTKNTNTKQSPFDASKRNRDEKMKNGMLKLHEKIASLNSSLRDSDTEMKVKSQILELLTVLDDEIEMKNLPETQAELVLSVLGQLKFLTVEILKSTGIGKTVNRLRKHPHSHVSSLAQELLAKWKKEVLG